MSHTLTFLQDMLVCAISKNCCLWPPVGPWGNGYWYLIHGCSLKWMTWLCELMGEGWSGQNNPSSVLLFLSCHMFCFFLRNECKLAKSAACRFQNHLVSICIHGKCPIVVCVSYSLSSPLSLFNFICFFMIFPEATSNIRWGFRATSCSSSERTRT